MSEFFWGWRRKVGVLTLLMACVFAAGWVRSGYSRDACGWEPGPCGIIVISVDNMLSIAAGIFHDPLNCAWPGFESTPFQTYADQDDNVRWRWTWAGIRLGTSIEPPPETDVYFVIDIFYPWIVIPLTALSAFLLGSKPSPSNQKKTDEPIPKKVT